ncbi:MAG: conjugal transfer protein TrbE [Shewanella sp.]
MFQTAKYRTPSMGFSDLLNYAILADDGVILNKDGSLMAGFAFAGPDISSATVSERNDLMGRINRVLCGFGTGWMTHVEAVRDRSPNYLDTQGAAFPHPVFAMIDAERQDYYQRVSTRYDSDYYLFVTYMPPNKAKSAIANFMFEQNSNVKQGYQKHLDVFKSKLREVESNLSGYIQIKQLNAYKPSVHSQFYCCKLLEALNHCISGAHHPMQLPFCPSGLDTLLGLHDFWTGLSPKLDDQLLMTISVNDFPDSSVPNMLYHLDKLGMSYRWSTRFCFFDATDAEKALRKEQRAWKQKIISFKDRFINNPNPTIDTDAQRMHVQYSQAADMVKSNGVQYGHYTSTLIIRATTQEALDDMAERLINAIRHLGFNAITESVNSVDAFLGSLPSDSLHNVRRPLVSTLNLAAMLPTSAQWTGNITNPNPMYPEHSPALMQVGGEGNAPFWLNLHHDDLGHSLVFGPPGAGKSTLLALLVAQASRYPHCKQFVFDKDYSAFAISQCGGVHYDICKDSTVSFAPLSKLRDDFDWTVDFVVKLLALRQLHVTPRQRNEIQATLRNLADTDTLEHITLSEFVNVADVEIAEALQHYTLGSAGSLLNNPSDSFQNAALQVFEMGELMSKGDQDLLPVLIYLFRQIELSLDGHPAFLWIDEAWVALQNPIFEAMVEEWLRVLRKKNCVVALFTQSLGEAAKSAIFEMLMIACPTKVFLPNPDADNPTLKTIYQGFGLNSRQIAIIKEGQRKRDYYITQPEGNRLFNLNLGELSLAFVAKSGKHDLNAIREHISEYGAQWYQHWLVTCGIIDEQTRQEFASAQQPASP